MAFIPVFINYTSQTNPDSDDHYTTKEYITKVAAVNCTLCRSLKSLHAGHFGCGFGRAAPEVS